MVEASAAIHAHNLPFLRKAQPFLRVTPPDSALSAYFRH
jgi:hypothetical protein